MLSLQQETDFVDIFFCRAVPGCAADEIIYLHVPQDHMDIFVA